MQLATASAMIDIRPTSAAGREAPTAPDREHVPNSEEWSEVVELRIDYSAALCSGIGTGVLVSDYHVLTAGHVVYDHGEACDDAPAQGHVAPEDVDVLPAVNKVDVDDDNPYYPYDKAEVTNIRVHAGWEEHQQWRHDIALLTLDRSVGTDAAAGTRTLAEPEGPDDEMFEESIQLLGFPVAKQSDTMWISRGKGQGAPKWNPVVLGDGHLHEYDLKQTPGMSGGPVINDEGKVVSTASKTFTFPGFEASYGVWFPTGYYQGNVNGDDKNRRDWVYRNIAEDPPPDDMAMPAFDEVTWDPDANTSINFEIGGEEVTSEDPPYNVVAGTETFRAERDVRNVGTRAIQRLEIGFYLHRRDDEGNVVEEGAITESKEFENEIAPFETTEVDWEYVFPEDTVDNEYELEMKIENVDPSEYLTTKSVHSSPGPGHRAPYLMTKNDRGSLAVEPPQEDDEAEQITGQIRQPNGAPAANHTLVMMTEDDSIVEWLTTDREGNFSYDKPEVTHDIQYYQLRDTDTSNAQFDPEGQPYPRDGTPDVFAVARRTLSDTSDVGVSNLPEAHPLDVRVVDQNDTPIEQALVIIEHVNEEAGGTAGLQGVTDQNGYYDVWPSNDVTGLEVHGQIQVTAGPPPDNDAFTDSTKERELQVTEPAEITVTLTRNDRTNQNEVTGRILQPDGAPAAKDTLVIYRVADKELVEWVTTDEDGYFSYSVDTDERYDIQYYQVYDTNTDNNRFDPGGPRGPRDGVPDLFALVQHQGPDTLGTLELPEAYPLDIRVIDGDDNPIENARVTVEHYSADDADAGLGPRLTNQNGYFVWGGGNTGIELRGDVNVVVRPPEGSNNYEISEKERDIQVTSPTTLEVILDQIDP